MAERAGLTTRKFDISLWGTGPAAGYVGSVYGGGPRVVARRVAGCAPKSGWVGSRDWIEPSSIVTEPVTGPPVRSVVERLGDRRRRLGVVEEHGVLPRLAALGRAEVVLELGEELGVRCLGAAAGTEDRTDERGHRDHVVDCRGWLLDVMRLEVRVDAVGFGLRVGDDRATFGTVGSDEELLLVGHELLGLRARARTTGHS